MVINCLCDHNTFRISLANIMQVLFKNLRIFVSKASMITEKPLSLETVCTY